MREPSDVAKATGTWPAIAILFLLPLAFLGVRGPVPMSSIAAPPAATRPAVPIADECRENFDPVSPYCACRFLSPLSQFIGQAHSLAPPLICKEVGADWRDRLQETLAQLVSVYPSLKIDTIVATLPDPIDSGYGYKFDTALQAIRLGIETRVEATAPSSWPQSVVDTSPRFRDASWLPWDDVADLDVDRKKSEDCRHQLPGVVMFRSGAEAARMTALLLVGETATTGVHRAALVRAAQAADEFHAASVMVPPGTARPTAPPLRVLGPAFSGGAASLRGALKEYSSNRSGPPRHVHVVTGSATGSGLATTLASGEAAPWFLNGTVRFSATTVPESELHCRYLWFVADRDEIRDNDRLYSVALLHESGTEFGAPRSGSSCRLEPGVDVSFPAHISALREAYEQMDRGRKSSKGQMARSTTLEVSLRERRQPLGIDAFPSEKTTYARDIAVTRVLEGVSDSTVRHILIQATDVADAIFLARKIRDVTPDVRLAFTSTDALLLHPSFRESLQGSLVVSPYPFLGTSPYVATPRGNDLEADAVAGKRVLEGFESDMAQGLFNGTLALRGAPADLLREYVAPQGGGVLPVWIAAIGDGEFIPLAVLPNEVPRNRDRVGTVYPRFAEAGLSSCSHENEGLDAASSNASSGARTMAWKLAVAPLHEGKLDLAPDVRTPRVWQFLIYALALSFAVDRILQRRTRRSLSNVRFPRSMRPEADRAVDCAIVRTKWLFYAGIRTFAVVVGFVYLATFWILGAWSRSDATGWFGLPEVGLMLASVLGLGFLVRDQARFLRNYWAFRHLALSSTHQGASDSDDMDMWDKCTLFLGLSRADSNVAPARLSFAQLRLLTAFCVIVAIWFLGSQLYAFLLSMHVAGQWSEVAMTLFVQRTLDLSNGVSTAAPTLAFLAVVYVWAVGRMSRLALVHGLSRATPFDGIPDLVSTPMRLVLYPKHRNDAPSDDAFTRVERQTVNTIIRPITGPSYCVALWISLILPVAIFLLSPISTLERSLDATLVGLHYLCSLLISNTLIQLFQYWRALEALLKRISQHRLGRAFRRVGAFVREPLSEQVSRHPSDLLRIAECARQFDDLVRWGKRIDSPIFSEKDQEDFGRRLSKLKVLRTKAVQKGSSRRIELAASAQARLSVAVVSAAQAVMMVVWQVWDGERYGRNFVNPPEMPPPPVPTPSLLPELRPPPSSMVRAGQPPEPEGARLPTAPPASDKPPNMWSFNDGEKRWFQDAEAFAATVVAIIINRHVRQLQYFVYTLLGCSLLFMTAILWYPFEPHRLLHTWAWILTLTAIGVGLWTYLELDRNSLLSNIAETDPGKLTLDRGLVFRILAWGIAPLLAAVAAEYPDLVNAISQFLPMIEK